MILGLFLSSPTPISLTDIEEVVSNKVNVFVFISLEEVSHDELIFLGSPLATTFPIPAATFKSTATFLFARAEAHPLAPLACAETHGLSSACP